VKKSIFKFLCLSFFFFASPFYSFAQEFSESDSYSDEKSDPDEMDEIDTFDDEKSDPDEDDSQKFDDEKKDPDDEDEMYDDEEDNFDDEKEDPDDEDVMDEEAEEPNDEEEIEETEETEETEEIEEAEVVEKDSTPKFNKNSLATSLKFMTIPSDYYSSYTIWDIRYRNYFHEPYYWFAGGAFGKALPNEDFPYTYQVGGKNLGKPLSYLSHTYGGVGYFYKNREYDFSLFTEFSLGMAIRVLYNENIKNAHFGKVYPSMVTDLAVGGTWKSLICELGIAFDTNLKFEINGSVGIKIPTSSLKAFFSKKSPN